MVDLYLAARLHNRISDADYRSLLLKQDLDQQEQKLRQTLLQLIDAGAIRLDADFHVVVDDPFDGYEDLHLVSTSCWAGFRRTA